MSDRERRRLRKHMETCAGCSMPGCLDWQDPKRAWFSAPSWRDPRRAPLVSELPPRLYTRAETLAVMRRAAAEAIASLDDDSLRHCLEDDDLAALLDNPETP